MIGRTGWARTFNRFPSRTVKRSLLLVSCFCALYWNDRFLTVMTNYKSFQIDHFVPLDFWLTEVPELLATSKMSATLGWERISIPYSDENTWGYSKKVRIFISFFIAHPLDSMPFFSLLNASPYSIAVATTYSRLPVKHHLVLQLWRTTKWKNCCVVLQITPYTNPGNLRAASAFVFILLYSSVPYCTLHFYWHF